MRIGRIFSFKIILFVFFLGLCMGLSTAQAASYYLDQSNVLADGTNYLEVSITKKSDGDIHFTIDVLEENFPYNEESNENFGMQDFYFNYDKTALGTTLTSANFANFDPEVWGVRDATNAGGDFGTFELYLKGSGGSRVMLLNFDIIGVSTDDEDSYAMSYTGSETEGEFFAAHVGGYGENGDDSAKFAGSTEVPNTAVPVPSAAYLLGSGLIFMVGLRRRKKK